MQTELSSARAALRPLQLQAERAEAERDHAAKTRQWLDDELAARSAALLEARKVASAERVDLTVVAEEARAAAAAATRSAAADAAAAEALRGTVSSLQAALRDAEAGAARTRDALERQLASTTRLAELYKAAGEDAAARVADLETAGAAEVAAARDATAAALRERDDAVRDAAEARQRLDELEARAAAAAATTSASATTAAASLAAGAPATPASAVAHMAEALETRRALQSTVGGDGVPTDTSGFRASALLARVVKAEEELETERAERSMLASYLEQILNAVAAKTPILEQQRRDYERALVAHEDLARRLDAALAEAAEAVAARGRAEEELRAAKDQLELQRSSVNDLSQQVRRLLYAQLGTRGAASGPRHKSAVFGGSGSATPGTGGTIMTPGGGPAGESDVQTQQRFSSASPHSTSIPGAQGAVAASPTMLDENLLTFADIDELQARNEHLVGVIRKLELDQKSQTQRGSGGDATRVGGAEALREIMSELSSLRSARERQETMVATLVQQRDAYRSLLQAKDMESATGGPVHAATSKSHGLGVADASAASASSTSAVDASVAALSAALADTRAELDAARREARESAAATAVASDAARDELSKLRIAVASADAASRFHEERVAALHDAEAAARAEAARESRRCVELQELVVRHQKALGDADAAAAAARDDASTSRAALAATRAERDVAAASEARMAAALRDASEGKATGTSLPAAAAACHRPTAEERRTDAPAHHLALAPCSDRDRYSRLVDSMRSREAGAAARDAAEREALNEDRTRLAGEARTARAALEAERALAAQRAAAATAESRDAARRSEEAAAALAAAKGDAAGARAEAEALRSQLAALNERLAASSTRLEVRHTRALCLTCCRWCSRPTMLHAHVAVSARDPVPPTTTTATRCCCRRCRAASPRSVPEAAWIPPSSQRSNLVSPP